MPAQTTVTTPYATAPYITTAEYRNAPTGVDTDDLVDGAEPGSQSAELVNTIARASSWVDTICNQTLAATVDTENAVVRPNRWGEIICKTSFWPILEVRSLQYGTTVTNPTVLTDLSSVFIERAFFRAALNSVISSSVGPLQFGSPMAGAPLYCRWTYVNGYPNTLLAASTVAGALTFTVTDATGIYANLTRLTIYDGANTENVVVAGVVGNVITPATPLAYAHTVNSTNPVSVSALPPAVKQATILLTSALIQTRGDLAVVMDEMGLGGPKKLQGADGDVYVNAALADELLTPYRREF